MLALELAAEFPDADTYSKGANCCSNDGSWQHELGNGGLGFVGGPAGPGGWWS